MGPGQIDQTNLEIMPYISGVADILSEVIWGV